jgi:archaellum biogenesis ATPase FlaH
MSAINIINGEDKTRSKNAIPSILSDALGVCFDPDVGHDYLEDSTDRFDFYHRVEERLPFDIDILNKITNGGLPNKTLNVLVGGVNAGKTLILCHVAAASLKQQKNVLYITLEMAQEWIAQRIDANLLDVAMDRILKLDKDEYDRKMRRLREIYKGKLIIKEFPTASAGAHHFKALLNELWMKKQFKPDIIIIDYINICCSSRLKRGAGVGMYEYIKSIAEELRGLAVEMGPPVLTATQLNREGFSSSDPDMTDVAESFGLPATADFMLVMIALDILNQIMIKQIKSRYGDKTKNEKFNLGIDRDKMRIYDPDKQVQKVNETIQPVLDRDSGNTSTEMQNIKEWQKEMDSNRPKFSPEEWGI